MDTVDSVVFFECVNRVLILTIRNPPVNALGKDVRQGLLDALLVAEESAEIDAVLIVGAGRNFIGGADIREFGKVPQDPALPEICQRIEDSKKWVIAAIHGVALGGGLEVALAAHYRICSPDALVGFPEVNLGLLPGAGGTQRAPRLVGAGPALEWILGGKAISAMKAHSAGLIDKIVEGDLRVAGLACIHELLESEAPRRRSRDGLGLADHHASQSAIDDAKQQVAKTGHGLFAPAKIIEAVQAALDLPFEQGLIVERKAFLACMESPQRAGLIHVFFAEREVLKAPETRTSNPRSIARVGVVGGGTMGAGIAVSLLDGGLSVTMLERDDAALAHGRENVEKVYDQLIVKGRMTVDGKTAVLKRFHASTDYGSLADADLVIEAVYEDLAIKQEVFRKLDHACKPGAILASNTSYLDIDAIAAVCSRPNDVIGLHFFSPANVMRLLEVVITSQVSPDVVATAFDLAKKLRKVPVRAGICDGFIGNRILSIYRQAAEYMVEDGASPYQIDDALRAFGFPMGPYEVVDLAGGDIGWATRKRRAATRDPLARYVQISDRLCERGWFGQKTGRGYYQYPHGARKGVPDPEVESIIRDERERVGIAPRAFSPQEIIRRYMAAMINEGANVLHDGIALRPLDIDVVLIYGYGFPRFRGGPMFYADQLGLKNVLADIRDFAVEDPLFWKPSPLLENLVAEGRQFSDLNHLN